MIDFSFHYGRDSVSDFVLGPLHLTGQPASIAILIVCLTVLYIAWRLALAGPRLALRLWRERQESRVAQAEGSVITDLSSTLPALRDLERLYASSVSADWLAGQEKRRQRLVWGKFFFPLPVGILAAIYLFLFDKTSMLQSVIAAVLVIGTGAVHFAVGSFKRDIGRKLARDLAGPLGLSYAPEQRKEDPGQFPIFPAATTVLLRDTFSGAEDGVSYRFYTVKYWSVRETGGGTREIRLGGNRTVIEITFARPFPGRTRVYREGGIFGTPYPQGGMPEGLARVNLGYKKFEDLYEVYSTSQVDARLLLTPDTLEKLVELARVPPFGARLETVALEGSRMFVLFEGQALMAPIGIRTRLDGPALFRRFAAALALVRTLEDGLGLRPYRSRIS